LTYYLENEPATSLFAANQLFSSFAGVQAHEKFIKKAAPATPKSLVQPALPHTGREPPGSQACSVRMTTAYRQDSKNNVYHPSRLFPADNFSKLSSIFDSLS
jgi:hypothetical protein